MKIWYNYRNKVFTADPLVSCIIQNEKFTRDKNDLEVTIPSTCSDLNLKKRLKFSDSIQHLLKFECLLLRKCFEQKSTFYYKWVHTREKVHLFAQFVYEGSTELFFSLCIPWIIAINRIQKDSACLEYWKDRRVASLLSSFNCFKRSVRSSMNSHSRVASRLAKHLSYFYFKFKFKMFCSLNLSV